MDGWMDGWMDGRTDGLMDDQTDTFLKWPKLEAKVPKFKCMAYHSRPKLKFTTHIGESEFSFLGSPSDSSLSS
jgi:extradiol dioxygenase family protein